MFGNLFKKKVSGALTETKKTFWQRLTSIIYPGQNKVDDDLIESIEDILISLDFGIDTTSGLIHEISKELKKFSSITDDVLTNILINTSLTLFKDHSQEVLPHNNSPRVIVVVGINGVGKTTTVGKLAAKFKREKKTVVIGAADTFRAAAVSQLQHWANLSGAQFVNKGQDSDPSSVAYESVKVAIETKSDVVIIDTSGRLHNKTNLMNELAKICRVVKKLIPDAPHEIMLVIDGTTGQNGYQQVKAFSEIVDVNSIAVTKLDGTSKGGIIVAIASKFNIPIKYIGVGETIEDLDDFDKIDFVKSIFAK